MGKSAVADSPKDGKLGPDGTQSSHFVAAVKWPYARFGHATYLTALRVLSYLRVKNFLIWPSDVHLEV